MASVPGILFELAVLKQLQTGCECSPAFHKANHKANRQSHATLTVAEVGIGEGVRRPRYRCDPTGSRLYPIH